MPPENILNAPAGDPAPPATPPVNDPAPGTTTPATPPANDPPNGNQETQKPAQGVPPTTDKTDPDTPSGETPQGDDWAAIRTKVANGDDKLLGILSRYGTLDEALKAGVEAKRKLDAHRGSKPLTAESTPEEIKAYREANGIPENAKDYKIELADGLVLGEEHKELADAFMQIAHENNLPPGVVNKLISWNLKESERVMGEMVAQDKLLQQQTTQTLRSKDGWGHEYDLNVNRINALLDQGPPGLKDQIIGGRLADGSLIGNNLDAMQWLDSIARKEMPLATITPTFGKTQLETAQSELASLQGLMGDPNSEYWKGPNASKNQERVRQLNEMLSKVSG